MTRTVAAVLVSRRRGRGIQPGKVVVDRALCRLARDSETTFAQRHWARGGHVRLLR